MPGHVCGCAASACSRRVSRLIVWSIARNGPATRTPSRPAAARSSAGARSAAGSHPPCEPTRRPDQDHHVSQDLKFGSKQATVRTRNPDTVTGVAMTETAETAKLPEIEHIKSRKNGLDVLADIYRYAELGFEASEPEDRALFRWYGVYTQRAEASAASGDPGPSEETDGLFMLRIKFPNGIVNAEQLRTIGSLAERYGRSMGDITTRQNIQLHNLSIEDMPLVLDELNAVGLSFTQACGDVWRNVVGCPLAGVDGHELIDSRPLVAELERTFVGNREFSNLSRKFKVSVSACAHRCAQHEINDIGLIAVDKDGVVGYDVWVGGGLGASAKMGRRLDVFALPEEAADVCRAITVIFRDEGKRTKRTRARIKFLVDEWDVVRLRAAIETNIGRQTWTSVATGDAIVS